MVTIQIITRIRISFLNMVLDEMPGDHLGKCVVVYGPWMSVRNPDDPSNQPLRYFYFGSSLLSSVVRYYIAAVIGLEMWHPELWLKTVIIIM